MRIRFKGLVIAAALLMAQQIQASVAVDRPINVLFIGNSLTYYSKMPEIFARVAQDAHPGMRLNVQYVASDGAMLEDHWKLDWTRARLGERRWDFVVLQDQGALSRWIEGGKVHVAFPTSLQESVGKFAEVAQQEGAKVVLYETAPSRADAVAYTAWAYTEAANRNNAILAPAGRVLYAMDDDTRKVLLPHGGGGHPSPQGSCVIATTLAAAMFPAPARSMLPSCAEGQEAVLSAAAIIDRELRVIGHPGAYAPLPAPVFDPLPVVSAGQSLRPGLLSGTWYARDGGLPMSFGVRLTFGSPGEAASVSIDNYGVNTLQGMRVERAVRKHGLVSIDSRADGRMYQYVLARRGDTLTGLLGAYVNGGTTYTPVTFTRASKADDYFSHLAALQTDFDTERDSQGLDVALLGRYKALDAWLGSAEVKRVAWADPASDAWYTLLTGQNYADLGNDALALQYYTFAVRHFPASYDAFGARGQLLERLGRYGEALPDLTRAAALLKADHRGDGETEYSWRRDRVHQAMVSEHKEGPVAPR